MPVKVICQTALKMNRSFLTLVTLLVFIAEVSLLAVFPWVNSNAGYADMLKGLPDNMLMAFGMEGDVTNVNDYLYINFYNSIAIYIFMMVVIVLAVRLTAKLLGDTSLVYFLNASVSRKQFLMSQILVFKGVLFFLALVAFLGALVGKVFLPDQVFDFFDLAKINGELLALFMLIGSLCLLLSVISDNSNQALAYSTPLVLYFYLADVFRKLSKQLDWLDYATLFTVYDPDKICSNTHYFLMSSLVMVVASLVVDYGAVVYFSKRDLYL
ncbi:MULTISPECIES: hypothetical protein [Aerococcus]|uniref:ABC transporter permease n=1 Tax=Aerococcus mictus TaxID=2976810 RepID=A0A9Q4DDX7_9LACT|nr:MULTISPECIES: hypothetical protein [Aerococcus]AEA00517.1 hypothetical protein HMPREF9243_1995 [Aerococcus sp. Group 1]MCY3031318.1 hypothetical protein [Aerococcus sp. Group 1]MCY3055295.1 hypothetical protein [Aerococcus sp. Group 1]MCY3057025.1 hypothetical protein [Aerococcus sp. Group 1]MCY3062476.1 hypothetical protein [Aerococcus sp. Group 1]